MPSLTPFQIHARTVRCGLRLVTAAMAAAWAAPSLAGDVTITPADNLQAAINTAASGDTIRFSPGTYNQTAIIAGKSLTLEGTGGAEVTILTAAALNDTVLLIQNAPSPGVTIRGLTIRDGTTPLALGTPDGYPHDGGGISANSSQLTIESCRFIANQAGDDGGAIYALNGSATITDTLFQDNAAVGSGGGGGAFLVRGIATVERCNFVGNAAGGAGGAAYFLNGSRGSFLDTDFVMNTAAAASGAGGAIYHATTLPVTMMGCQFSDNSSGASGGAIATGELGAAGSLELTRCTFTENRTTTVAGDGGAVYAGNNVTLSVLECMFTKNSAFDNGGAIYKFGSAGTFSTSSSSYLGNRGLRGGGVRSNTTSTMVNCRFVANQVVGAGFGAALYDGKAAGQTFNVLNSTFVANQGPDPVVGGGTGSFKNCIVRGNGNNAINAGQLFTHSNVEQATGVRAGVGNINAAPLFAALPNPGGDGTWGTTDDVYGDLQLLAGSPGIDAGDSPAALPYMTDLAGEDRNVDDPATANSGIPAWALNVDMGAYEFQPEPPQPACPADFNNSGTVSVQDIFDYLAAYFAGCP